MREYTNKTKQLTRVIQNSRNNQQVGFTDNRERENTQLKTTGIIQRIIDLNGATIKKAGPPATVIKDGYYYKVFTSKTPATNMKETWDTVAEHITVPFNDIKEVTYNGRKQWAFRSKTVNGRFFKLAENGHLTFLKTWINQQTDVGYLERLKNVFRYVRDNIGDGQGIYEEKLRGHIYFIDINHPGTTPNADDIVTSITERINNLS